MVVAMSAFALANCGGDGADGVNGLVSATVEEAGANCPNGGISIETGSDTNGNGALDADEVLQTEFVCSGSEGLPNLVVTTAEPPGVNCPQGGQRVEFGIDDNANGVLDIAEVDGSTFVCDGLVSLVAQSNEPDGLNCGTGGTRIDTGIDLNGSGELDTFEITDTDFVCNAGFGLIVADASTGNFGSTPGNIYSVNSQTGVATIIAPLTDTVTALAFDANGTLFGTTRGGVNPEGEIVTIDVATGTITPVGPSGLNLLPDISFAPDGTLFAWTENNDDLATIDPATGVATVIASPINSAGSGLAVADDGTIFFTANGSSFQTVDPSSGASLSTIAMSGSIAPINAMTFVDGVLYGIQKAAVGRSLVTIDPSTGAVTIVGAGGGLSDNADALAVPQ